MEVAPQVGDAAAPACPVEGEVETKGGSHSDDEGVTSAAHLETASAAHNRLDCISSANDVGPAERGGDQSVVSVPTADFGGPSKEESTKAVIAGPISGILQDTGEGELLKSVAVENKVEVTAGSEDEAKVLRETPVVDGETAKAVSSQSGTVEEKVETMEQMGDVEESGTSLEGAGVADHAALPLNGAGDNSKLEPEPLGGPEEGSLPQNPGREGQGVPLSPAAGVLNGDSVVLPPEEDPSAEGDDPCTLPVKAAVDSEMDWTPLDVSNEVKLPQTVGSQEADVPDLPASEVQNGDAVSLPSEEVTVSKKDLDTTFPVKDVLDNNMDRTPLGDSNEPGPPLNPGCEEQDVSTPSACLVENGDEKIRDADSIPSSDGEDTGQRADVTSRTVLPHEEDFTGSAEGTTSATVQDAVDSKMEIESPGVPEDACPPTDVGSNMQDMSSTLASHVENGEPISVPEEEDVHKKDLGTSTLPVKDKEHGKEKKHESGRSKKHRKQRHKNMKKRKAEAESNIGDGEKSEKKRKTASGVASAKSTPPVEVSTAAPIAAPVPTRKITFKTRPKTPPSTLPEAVKKISPKSPAEAPPKGMIKSTTPKNATSRGGRGRKDDDGYAYFCALCHEFGVLLCCEKCKQVFHLACLGLDRLPEADPWMCDNCVENKVECFDCKEFTAIGGDVLLCSFKNCSKFFHEQCSKKWDRWDKANVGKASGTKKPRTFTCPHHICDACGNTKTPKRSKLYRCLYCPVAYHENCAPDGTQFLEDVPGYMSCWKHDDDWKREIQTGGQIRDLKTFFQQLPLPGVSNDFQVPQFIHEAVKKLNRKPSTYTHIRRNIYLAKKPRRRSEDEGMQCPCKASDSTKSACEKDCLCGMLLTSCSSSCGCGNSCKNVPFQKRRGQKLKAVKTQNCGWGLRADADIRAGEFLVEYVGEVIDDKTCEERLWALKRQGETNFYMCEISREMVIDATFKGNLSRYINHSCEPNSELQKWNMDGEVRIGVFAISDIKKGSFITYDYQFVQFGTDQKCHCGSTDCRGQLGVRSLRAKDASMSPVVRSRPSSGPKFFEQNSSNIGRAFRQRRDQLPDGTGTRDLQFVRYHSGDARKWVGQRVAVWWPLDQKYYRGQIVSYNVNSKKHVITYDDGDLEDLNMSKETWLQENVACSQVASKA